MRASILILGLALMAIYIVHCEAFAIDGDSGILVRVKRQDDPAPADEAAGDAPKGDAPAGDAPKGDGAAAKPGDKKEKTANGTAIHIEGSAFKTMQFVVLPIVAAKIMM